MSNAASGIPGRRVAVVAVRRYSVGHASRLAHIA